MLLTELRIVTRETGYEEARRMPSEVRRWWINEMVKDSQEKQEEIDRLSGKKAV